MHLRTDAVIQLGLVLRIATPIARVVLATFGFYFERDRLYVRGEPYRSCDSYLQFYACVLKIVSRIGKIEALVTKRKIGNDVFENRVIQSRPVGKRGIFDFYTGKRTVFADNNPVPYRAAPSFN